MQRSMAHRTVGAFAFLLVTAGIVWADGGIGGAGPKT